jgi:hypothetical protein
VTKYGKNYARERAAFKATCAAGNEPCWICGNSKGPIDYTSRYAPGTQQPLLFNLDHQRPTSLGGPSDDPANFRASHYICNVSRGNTTRGQFPTSRQW